MADLREGRPLVPYYDNQLEAVTVEIDGLNYLRVTGGGGGGGDATAANQLTQIDIEANSQANIEEINVGNGVNTYGINGTQGTNFLLERLRTNTLNLVNKNVPIQVKFCPSASNVTLIDAVVFAYIDSSGFGNNQPVSYFGADNLTKFEALMINNNYRCSQLVPLGSGGVMPTPFCMDRTVHNIYSGTKILTISSGDVYILYYSDTTS